ncbi:MAG: peptidase domain-containing ABC transporter [Victivallales bacterium]
MSDQHKETLISCLREIAKMLPRGTELDAFVQSCDASSADSMEIGVELANKLRLSPEQRNDANADELASYFGAPVLLRLNNGNWVLFLGLRSQVTEGVTEERFAVFDPLSKTQGKMIFLTRPQLTSAWNGEAIFIKIELAGCSTDGRHTTLYCLSAIVKHHGGDTDVSRLIHEYAISEDEPARRLIRKMADDLEFATKMVKLSWKKLAGLGAAYPAMAFKKDGSAIVLCGVREVPVEKPAVPELPGNAGEPEITIETPEEQNKAPEEPELKQQLAIWDPVARNGRKPQMEFVEEEYFNNELSGEVLLLKKRYSLLEENQPFGLRWFVPEFFRQRVLLGQVAIAIISMSLIGLAIPIFFQLVVDKVLVHESYNTLTVLGFGVMVMLLFNGALEYLENYFLLFATNRIDIRLATRTFAKLLSLPVDFYERISSGVLIKHMQQTEKIRSFLSGSLFFSALELLSLVVFLPFLLFYSVKLTIVVLAFTLAMALVIAALIKPFQIRLEELYLAEGKRQGMLVETIHGIRTVKSLALEPSQQRKWNDTAAYAITRYFRVAKISMTARTLSNFLEKAMFVAIIWFGAKSVFDGTLSVGALIAFQMLSGRVTAPLVRIVGLVHEYQQTALSVKMLGVVMNCPGEQVGGSLHHQLRGEISIENVSFQYSADGPRVIKDCNLHIAPGTTVGLVGRSGSGKTTLTKLIQGLYPLQAGIIKFDGIDIREIDRSSLRSNIGIVLQDNYFFYGTVRENLTLTKKEASMEEVIYAARMAGADEFIQKMPKGYDSILEENASNLSGGQRQRLAIARALLPNPRLLIFDEATSALDPESETLVRKNLKMIARNRTVFIISHRLSILCRANKIVVMDKGELVETGTHKELIGRNGIYAEFWRQQMGTEDDEF